VSTWAKAEEMRIAALAARDAFWRVLERHHARVARGDMSLADEKVKAADRMWAAEVEYNAAAKVAERSGEPHPEDCDGC
jgi:hypothetical protein